MWNRYIATFVAGTAMTLAGNSAIAETIDFEGIPAATIVDQVFGDAGSGPIGVNADNVQLDALFLGPNNAAVIFDSSNPGGVDEDLGTPNEFYGGPGVGADGLSNDTALGNLLIINEAQFFSDDDLNDRIDSNDSVSVANDADNPNAPITLDFSAIGPVTIGSMDLIDIEQIEGAGTVTFLGAGDVFIATVNLPIPGDNGVAHVNLGPTANVMKMEVILGGSGAIDNIVFKIPRSGGEGCTPGYWKQPQHSDSWVSYAPGDSYDTVFGVSSSFSGTLLEALQRGGGNENALGRHAVAALLNAASDVDYAFSEAAIISRVQMAYATGEFNYYKDRLERQNEMGCPLN